MNTRDLLTQLGFQENWNAITDVQPGYFYDFGNLRLEANQVMSRYLQPVFLVTGVWKTPRIMSMIESEMLTTVDSYEQGVALIAHAVGDGFVPLIPTPWLADGRAWKDHLPGVAKQKAYAARPQCSVDSEWFKVAAKKIQEAIANSGKNDVASFSFDGEILRIEVCNKLVAMPGTGEAWKESYRISAQALGFLYKRIVGYPVYLSIWENHLVIRKRRFKLT